MEMELERIYSCTTQTTDRHATGSYLTAFSKLRLLFFSVTAEFVSGLEVLVNTDGITETSDL